MSLSPVITSASMDKERCVPVHSAFSRIWKRISRVDSIQAKAHAHSNKLPYSQYGGKLSFPSCPKPLFQSEVNYKAIDMKVTFILIQIKLIFTRKVFAH